MRKKERSLILTFHTTAAAMAMEGICAQNGLPGRLIPVPREITAGCGMAWKAPVESRTALERAAGEAGIAVDGVYELVV